MGKAALVGQQEVGRDQFGQRVKDERSRLHVVVRDFQARDVDQVIAVQQDIQVQGARAPALLAFTALGSFDGLQAVEQVQRC
ncbi:hypothetical protein D3C76_1082970 [compost metagenome]